MPSIPKLDVDAIAKLLAREGEKGLDARQLAELIGGDRHSIAKVLRKRPDLFAKAGERSGHGSQRWTLAPPTEEAAE